MRREQGRRERPLRTSDIAKAAGVHPNTIRVYEAWGYLPAAERGPNGYRCFTQHHLQQALLVRLLSRCTWLGGSIRKQTIAAILRSAAGDWVGALAAANATLDLVTDERLRAEHAISLVRAWAAVEPRAAEESRLMSIREAAASLAVTPDTLRNWERNGLIRVPRRRGNSYRTYGPAELRRLSVIRTLRRARYSMMAIYRMFRLLEADPAADPGAALDTLQPGEEDMFYCMDRWLTRVSEVEQAARQAVERVRKMSQQLA